jgi:hypothetical protein
MLTDAALVPRASTSAIARIACRPLAHVSLRAIPIRSSTCRCALALLRLRQFQRHHRWKNHTLKRAAEHNRKAAEHHSHAARHHGLAATHYHAGEREKAAHHSLKARTHVIRARDAEEAVKAHSDIDVTTDHPKDASPAKQQNH